VNRRENDVARPLERLVCDTSVVGHLLLRENEIDRYAHWDADGSSERVSKAARAISLVTIAESRSGYLIGRWGYKRMETYEQHLARFEQIPVERDFVSEWARLRAAAKGRGVAIGDNDLWIAATAHTRGYPLVTCDRDHERIADDLGVEVVFLAPPV
jgi:predicted nucleic acid-binding protein